MPTNLGIAIAGLAAALGIAACGGDDGVGGGGGNGEVPVAQGGKATGDVLISNWPGYVAPGDNGTIAIISSTPGSGGSGGSSGAASASSWVPPPGPGVSSEQPSALTRTAIRAADIHFRTNSRVIAFSFEVNFMCMGSDIR